MALGAPGHRRSPHPQTGSGSEQHAPQATRQRRGRGTAQLRGPKPKASLSRSIFRKCTFKCVHTSPVLSPQNQGTLRLGVPKSSVNVQARGTRSRRTRSARTHHVTERRRQQRGKRHLKTQWSKTGVDLLSDRKRSSSLYCVPGTAEGDEGDRPLHLVRGRLQSQSSTAGVMPTPERGWAVEGT